jgi:hypothetical protein
MGDPAARSRSEFAKLYCHMMRLDPAQRRDSTTCADEFVPARAQHGLGHR